MIKVFFAILFIFWSLLAFGQEAKVDVRQGMYDYDIKALYVYNFTKLTQWPEDIGASGGVDICIVNQDDVYQSLKNRISSLTGHQNIRLIHVHHSRDAEYCNVLFVGEYRGEVARRLSVLFRGKPLLLITDDLRVEREGVMIYIYKRNDRLAFDVYIDKLRSSNLSVSSKLLRLADRVID
jgi:hypothetical protein